MKLVTALLMVAGLSACTVADLQKVNRMEAPVAVDLGVEHLEVQAGCNDLTVAMSGWPDDAHVIVAFGSAPPLGPYVNTTNTWHFGAELPEVAWAVDIFQPDGATIEHREGIVDCPDLPPPSYWQGSLP